MTLHLCLDCATIYDCNGCKPVCPQCGKKLGLQPEETDKVATIAEVAGWAMCGFPERRRRLWEVR